MRGVRDFVRFNLEVRIKVAAEGVTAVAIAGGIAAAIVGKYLEFLGRRDTGNLTLFNFGVVAFLVGVFLQLALLMTSRG